eukprot:m.112010 g.112010  ORF g.112010 m.112010 type:complete len:393 (+) comp28161_c0_seq1:208-1386(+)
MNILPAHRAQTTRILILLACCWIRLNDAEIGVDDRSRVSDDRLWLISIGSSSRQQLQGIQSATIGKHYKIIKHTEETLPTCDVCPVGTGLPYPETMGIYENNRMANKEDKVYTEGWWCAQKRVLLALDNLLESTPTSDLPPFLMIIDDDTFVNPQMLSKFLDKQNESKPFFTGDIMHSRDAHGHGETPWWFVGGGGGTLISRALLVLLRSTVGTCLQKAQSGDWCDWHSDWTLAACIHDTARLKPIQSRPIFNQLGGQVQCHRFAATCHTNLSTWHLTFLYHNFTTRDPDDNDAIKTLDAYLYWVTQNDSKAEREIINLAVSMGRARRPESVLWPLITRAINIRRTLPIPLSVDLLRSARTNCARWGLSMCANIAHRYLVKESSDGVGWGGW